MTRQDELRRIEHAIIRISRIGMGRAAARLRSQRSGVDLSRPAISVLSALNAAGPMRVGDLAESTDLEPPLVSREVRALEAGGYLRRRPDPADGRASIVALAAKGRHAYDAYRRATDEIIADTFAGWTARDLTTLAHLLERVATDFASVPGPSAARSSPAHTGGSAPRVTS